MKQRNQYRTASGRLNHDVASGLAWFVGIIAIWSIIMIQAICFIIGFILRKLKRKNN